LPVVALYDLPACCKTNSAALVLRRTMKALKHIEYTDVVAGVNAAPVVLNRKHPSVFSRRCRNTNLRGVVPSVLDCVADKVLEQTQDLFWITVHRGQRVDADLSPGCLDCRLKIPKREFNHGKCLNLNVRHLRPFADSG